MPRHRLVFEFGATVGAAGTAGAQCGWTELWYHPANVSDDAAVTRAFTYKNRRLDLLTPGWSILAIRVSQLDASNNPTRKGSLIQLPPQGNAGLYPGPAASVDEQPWDAINLSVQSLGGTRRAFLMRGIGNDVIGASSRFKNPAGWSAAYPNYVFSVTNGLRGDFGDQNDPLALRTRTSVALTAISTVLTIAPANVTLVTDVTRPLIRVAAATVQAGNTVSITGVEGVTNVNGEWRVAAIQVDPLTNQFVYASLSPRRRIKVAGTYTVGGTARYWNWLLDPITGITAGNGASRRTGRPPQQLRGRRSNRR